VFYQRFLVIREIQVIRENKCIRESLWRSYIATLLVEYSKYLFCHKPFKSPFPHRHSRRCLTKLTPDRKVQRFFYQGTGAPFIGRE
jgi:hypothetical protein